jgi:hypothetical protein
MSSRDHRGNLAEANALPFLHGKVLNRPILRAKAGIRQRTGLEIEGNRTRDEGESLNERSAGQRKCLRTSAANSALLQRRSERAERSFSCLAVPFSTAVDSSVFVTHRITDHTRAWRRIKN